MNWTAFTIGSILPAIGVVVYYVGYRNGARYASKLWKDGLGEVMKRG